MTALLWALGLAFAATAGRLLYERSFTLGLSALAVAILLFIASINLPRSYLLSVSLVVAAVIVFLATTIISWADIKSRAGNPRYRKFLLIAFVLCFAIYVLLYMDALRSDIDTYVLPRTITQKQADELRVNLSHRERYTVTVKVNPYDEEALNYAGQIVGALKRANWEATLDTSGGDPSTASNGLCIGVVGDGSNIGIPYDPKHDFRKALEDAFTAADIEINCGHGSATKNYRLYVLVGHRPVVLRFRDPVLVRFRRWIIRNLIQ